MIDAYGDDYAVIEFIDGPGAGGMGLLSRFPVQTVEVLPSPIGWFPAWLVRVETPEVPLQVLSSVAVEVQDLGRSDHLPVMVDFVVD